MTVENGGAAAVDGAEDGAILDERTAKRAVALRREGVKLSSDDLTSQSSSGKNYEDLRTS